MLCAGRAIGGLAASEHEGERPKDASCSLQCALTRSRIAEKTLRFCAFAVKAFAALAGLAESRLLSEVI
jgi:hypothetical protein